jgi:hypothetical protein
MSLETVLDEQQAVIDKAASSTESATKPDI